MIKGFENCPYIANSVPKIQEEMLKEIGLSTLEELHKNVPDLLKLKKNMNLPKTLKSEYELRRHVVELFKNDIDAGKYLNFIGAGCYQHYVPAICDEIAGKGEFLTAYGGEVYNDKGRFQALFEYQSMVAELVGMDVVNVPTMDYAQAAATTIRMAQRITGKKELIVPEFIDPEKLQIMKNYSASTIDFIMVKMNQKGQIDIEDLKSKLNENIIGIYFENPNYLGIIEENASQISEFVKEKGGLSLVGVDPISLGVMEAPAEYGADIVCGDLQSLGIHMNYGGGQSGFMAVKDEERFVLEFPSRIFGIVPTIESSEYGFADIAYDRTSFGHLREKAKEYVGTQTALWGIVAGVYLATMGPKGMFEVGQTILQNSQYAAMKIGEIEKVKVNSFGSSYFKEFVVDFTETGKSVKEINLALLKDGIFGGKDLSNEFPGLGQSVLLCVTEIHTAGDIEYLVEAIKRALK